MNQKDIEQILNDKTSDSEMKTLAEKELEVLKEKKIKGGKSSKMRSSNSAALGGRSHKPDPVFEL